MKIKMSDEGIQSINSKQKINETLPTKHNDTETYSSKDISPNIKSGVTTFHFRRNTLSRNVPNANPRYLT